MGERVRIKKHLKDTYRNSRLQLVSTMLSAIGVSGVNNGIVWFVKAEVKGELREIGRGTLTWSRSTGTQICPSSLIPG